MKKHNLYILLVLLLLSSCSQYKRFTYLQLKPPVRDSLYEKKITPYKLQPADNVYIKVYSPLNKSTQDLFNTESSSNSALYGGQGGGLYLMGNLISHEGFLNLPVIGKIHVAGLTIDELKVKIQEQVSRLDSSTQVDIKLLSFKVSILGEIKAPGQYTIFSERASILEALAMAGDITYNGNRKKILVLRSFNEGTQTIEIDLTKRSILDSDKYFLQPNDIIYIEPFRTTAFRLRINDYSQFLTMITSTITAIILLNTVLKK